MEGLFASVPGWVWAILGPVVLWLLGFALNALRWPRASESQRSLPGAVPNQGFKWEQQPVRPPMEMVSFDEVYREYQSRLRRWSKSKDEVASLQSEVDGLDIGALDAQEIVDRATIEERANLRVMLGLAPDAGSAEMMGALRKAGSRSIASMVRGGHVPYEEVVRDVALKLGAKADLKGCSAAELERAAVGAALKSMLGKATPEQRQALLAELAKTDPKSSSALLATAGGLAMANLSGFGLYLAASSSLAAVTGAVGLTLPFAVYTGMSSVLAVITGPAGWAALIFLTVFKLSGVDYKKTVPGVIAVAAVRARLMSEREAKIARLALRQSSVEDERRRLHRLEGFLDGMRRAGKERPVPRSSVPW